MATVATNPSKILERAFTAFEEMNHPVTFLKIKDALAGLIGEIKDAGNVEEAELYEDKLGKLTEIAEERAICMDLEVMESGKNIFYMCNVGTKKEEIIKVPKELLEELLEKEG